MDEMMDRETGHHRVKSTQLGKGFFQIVGHDLTERSPAKRLCAASSMAGEKSIATAVAPGWANLTKASRRPSPVPRSSMR